MAGLQSIVMAALKGGQPQGNVGDTVNPLSGLHTFSTDLTAQSQPMQDLASPFGQNMSTKESLDPITLNEIMIDEKDLTDAGA